MTSAVLILAAGQGKRMKSTLPKVLHSAGGQPLLFHIFDRILEAMPDAPIGLVVGHGRDLVEAAVRAEPRFRRLSIDFIFQAEQNGTGHAARCAMESKWGEKVLREKRNLLVLPGDLPLITRELLKQVAESMSKKAALRLLTCDLPDPTGYGRVIRRGKSGSVLRIVEERDTNLRERAIREVATSIYFFHGQFLRSGLLRLSNKNAQGEYYLTDLISQASRAKKAIEVLKWQDAEDLRGVNDPWELGIAGQILNRRIVQKHARNGVLFRDTGAAWIDVTVVIGEGTRVGPGVWLRGDTQVGKNVDLGANVVLTDANIGDDVEIKHGSVIERSRMGTGSKAGPYAHLRPESDVGPRAKIGNFVELKKTVIGEGSSVAHLSYLGDANVGARVNIGCGFVTCNFDGREIDGSRKHKTVIEDDVFMGSDCQAVAPVRIGRGAFVASGSTITEEVPSGALAIARSRQVTKLGYAKKLKTQE